MILQRNKVFLSNFTILYFINFTIQLQLHSSNCTIYSFSTQFHFEDYFVLIFFARVVFNLFTHLFILTLQCLVSTKRTHLLKQTCSFQWTPGTKVLTEQPHQQQQYGFSIRTTLQVLPAIVFLQHFSRLNFSSFSTKLYLRFHHVRGFFPPESLLLI